MSGVRKQRRPMSSAVIELELEMQNLKRSIEELGRTAEVTASLLTLPMTRVPIGLGLAVLAVGLGLGEPVLCGLGLAFSAAWYAIVENDEVGA